jgi:hypothetical protein
MSSPDPPAVLTRHLLALAALFNRQSADLPDGVLRNDCVLRLNGRAYHEHLGRPPTDPLVRLVGCGPAGYRFVVSALRYALGQPRLALDEATVREDVVADGRRLHAVGRLTGVLRGTAVAFASECALDLSSDPEGRILEIGATAGDADVERIMAARRA